MMTQQHRIEVRRLTEEEGGGWLATFPDLPGCMSDGETPEEAYKMPEKLKFRGSQLMRNG